MLRWRGDRWYDLRTFAAGAACGLLVGVVLTILLAWRAGGDVGALQIDRVRDALGTPARPHESLADPGEDLPAIESPRRGGATGTTGRVRPAPAPPETAIVGPVERSAPDLEDRNLEMPVEGVRPETLTRQFDDPRGGSRHHEAIDILAPRHTPVKAVDDGTIARLFNSAAGGLTIYQFDPAQEYCYYYAHLERYAPGLKEGDRVSRGQVIGYIGTSGNAPPDTPHLHFAIFRLTAGKRWWEGTPIDPYDVLR